MLRSFTRPSSPADLAFVRALAADSALASLYHGPVTAEAMRGATAALLGHPRVRKPLPAITVELATLPGLEGEWLAKPAVGVQGSGATARNTPDTAQQGAVLFFHGGGYVRGSLALGRIDASEIADRTGIAVLAVAYRQAPEYRFPAAVLDAFSAYRALLDTGVPAERLVLVGESAGGALAIAAALQALQTATPMPAGIVGISPLLDLTLSGPAWTGPSETDVITRELGERMIGWYVDAHQRRDPLASPRFADLRGLPPLLLQLGGGERLADDVDAFAAAADAEGVSVTVRRYDGMPHGFTRFRLDAATAAISDAADWISERIGS